MVLNMSLLHLPMHLAISAVRAISLFVHHDDAYGVVELVGAKIAFLCVASVASVAAMWCVCMAALLISR